MKRAKNSGKKLTEEEAATVKGMLLRGDRQHDIAAWFGVNGGRVAEISKGATFLEVTPQTSNLPRPGPYLSGEASETLIQEFRKLRSKTRRIIGIRHLNPDVSAIAQSILDQLDGILDE